MLSPDYLQFKSYMEAQRLDVYHHGILGQKWGVKNGPPYPLDEKKDLKTKGEEFIKQYFKDFKEAKLTEKLLIGYGLDYYLVWKYIKSKKNVKMN